MNNKEFAQFCIDKVGTPYVMGTNGKIFTERMYNDLVSRNPGGWFKASRLSTIKSYIDKVTTDCHGLIEWFVRECTGESYDTTADNAFNSATEKGEISNIPEIQGICVRYPGHVGVYIGDGLVVEAKGFNDGVCITELKKRTWTHWYKHPKIEYMGGEECMKISKGMTTAQIQNVLNKGGYIEFDPATYNVTAPLYLKNNTQLNLNGAVLRQGGAFNQLILTDSDKNTTKYNGSRNIEIYGGTIEGMGKYKTPLNLITLCHAVNIYIHDMKFVDVVEFHHIEVNSSMNVAIVNCSFEGFNSSLDDSDFRECIQIDYAVESALVVVPLGSKWYDGTPSENVIIRGCDFKESKSRPAPSQCIGNHCQTSEKHKNIIIDECNFSGGDQSNPSGACVNLVGMENVILSNNDCKRFGRFCHVKTFTKSYNNKGSKVNASESDGVCSNILIEDNSVSEPSGTYLSSGVFVNSNTGKHKNVVARNNNIVKSGLMKYAVDLNKTIGGYISDNESKATMRVSTTCEGVVTK